MTRLKSRVASTSHCSKMWPLCISAEQKKVWDFSLYYMAAKFMHERRNSFIKENWYLHVFLQDIYFVLSILHGYFWNWRCAKVRIPLLKTFHPIVSYICRNCSKKLLRMCFTYIQNKVFLLTFIQWCPGDVNFWTPIFSKASSVFQIWFAN